MTDWPNQTAALQSLCHLVLLRGIELGLEAAADTLQAHDTRPGAWTLIVQAIRDLNADTIAREAVLDQLTREAQADNMGYDKEAAR